MKAILAVALGVMVSALASGALATTVFPAKFKCPIGGEKFEAAGYTAFGSWGYRPDGRPIGTGYGWYPHPECPKNGLILYREFSTTEIKLLKNLIVGPEFKAMRKTESQHYRVAWLEKALNPQSDMYFWYLLRATWEVDNQPEQKARYRQMFLKIAEAVPPDSTDIEWLWLRLRVANAYREMGQFDKARLILASVPQNCSGLIFSQAFKRGDPKAKFWSYRGFESEFQYMHKLLDREDKAVEPIDGMGLDEFAAEECYFRDPKTAFETEFCAHLKFQAIIIDQKDSYEEIRADRVRFNGSLQLLPSPPKRPKPYEKH